MTKGNTEFYFSEVTIKREENPHGLMDYELPSIRILELFIDGTKSGPNTSIALCKKDRSFPKEIRWNIFNDSIYKITLQILATDKEGNTLRKFWMPLYPLVSNEIDINDVPEETEKIMIVCHYENVIGKKATLTVVAKN